VKDAAVAKTVRTVHRVTGLALILLVGAKGVSGLRLAGALPFPPEAAAQWMHFSAGSNAVLLAAFAWHSAYGLLKLWNAARPASRRDAAFAAANTAALALFAAGLVALI
jgi:hypothetical protein